LRLLVFVFILLSSDFGNAQNLVPNFDFSLTDKNDHRPISGSLGSMNNWEPALAKNGVFIASGSAHDTMCGTSSALSSGGCPGSFVFNGTNQFLTPKAYSGSGLSSLYYHFDSTYLYNSISNGFSWLSYHHNSLSQQLLKDTNYCVEFHAMLFSGKTGSFEMCNTHNGLGVYFSSSDTLPSIQPWLINITPQISGFGYITNDSTWQKLKGSFVSDGSENHMYLGNFYPFDSPTLKTKISPSCDLFETSVLWIDAIYVYNCRDTLFKVVQRDTAVCWGQPVQLQPNLQGFKLQDSVRSYYWQTPGGSFTTADSTFTATAQGNYTVTITLNKRFTATTNFTITWVPEAPDTALLPDSLVLCPGEPQLLEAPEIPGARYRWSNGDTTRYTTIGLPGLYTLQVITPCWLHTENVLAYQSPCGTRIFIPNAFTPDGDGTNDYFEIFGPIEPFTLIVTDRWGKVVYQSDDYQNNWDGTYQNEPLPMGVYSYRIIYAKYEGGPKNYDKMGTLTLFRQN
jgi:gliding motility-associated-like protein